jgi:hypothetical protein
MKLCKQYIFVVLLLLLSGINSVYPSWKLLKTFPEPVSCGYFFDSDNGLIGTGNYYQKSVGFPKIYWTSDGGTNWTEAQTPDPANGWVTSIFMKDANIGYASIFSYTYTLWKTVDGGKTWADHTSEPIGFATCVYATGKALIQSFWRQGFSGTASGGRSLDDGVTLEQIFNEDGYYESNGIDFADDQNGVVVMGPGGGAPLNCWITNDGGVNWNKGGALPESWSVYGVKGTQKYFCLPEGFQGTQNRVLYRSSDGGKNWSQVYAFNTRMTFTGHIAGFRNTLYIQTELNTGLGLYRSDDLGATWKFVGGPSNLRDTRFVVTGCNGEEVFAFNDKGEVWKTTDGGDGTLSPFSASAVLGFLQDSLYMESHYCQAVRKYIDLFDQGCNSIIIDTILISPNPYNEFSVDTARSGITVSRISSQRIPIIFHTDSNVTRHTALHIKAHSGSQIIDTSIVLVAKHSTAPELLLGEMKKAHAGDTVFVPVFLRQTQDSFSISHYELHLSYDGDILAPAFNGYQISGTLSAASTVIVGIPEPNGVFCTVDLATPITQLSDLSSPLIYLRMAVSLSHNLSSSVRLDSFSISTSAPLSLCSIPQTEFIVEPECGDSLLSYFMFSGKLPEFLSIHPNPNSGEAIAEISMPQPAILTIEIIDAIGKIVQNVCSQKQFQSGRYSLPINTSSLSSGLYLLRLHTSEGRVMQREIIVAR